MGRPPRIEVPNGTFHVTSRGSDRRDIFTAGGDRAFCLKLLGIVAVKYTWTVLAYCLMTNHYHLVFQIADSGLSSGMQWLNGVFSRATNHEQGREAHLFRNRFKSRLIGSEAHLVVHAGTSSSTRSRRACASAPRTGSGAVTERRRASRSDPRSSRTASSCGYSRHRRTKRAGGIASS